MSTFSAIKSKIDPSKVPGSMGFFDETDFEKETSILSMVTSVVTETVTEVAKTAVDLGKEVKGAESKTESNGSGKFSIDGSIRFKNQAQQLEQYQKKLEESQKEQKETNRQKTFFQSLKENQEKVEREKDKIFEEEINDIITNLPTDQKNRLLHYQASYRDRSIYQRAELRKKIVEERNKAEKQEKATSIPSPAKQPSAMEGAFEGRSGNQGSGTANLSAQAVG